MQVLPFIQKHLLWVILAALIVILFALYALRPQPSRQFTPPLARISVQVKKLQREDIQADIRSYGMVEPRTLSRVVAQVSGRVIYVAEQFRDGGFFEEGDTLLQIETADYEIEAEIARANLTQAERALQEEIAQAEQAKMDWQRLGSSEQASPLVLREPQMEAAKANVRAAKARLRQAQLNLDRCTIKAPFRGRVLTKSVGLGQVVGNNSVVADIYASDAVEIRLPIKNRELVLLNLPEALPGEHVPTENLPDVKIISDLAGYEIWPGKIVRTASAIDSASRQLYVVARIDDPFGKQAMGRFPLKIGQYVTAKISGKTIENALSVPNRAIYQGTYVYVYREGAVYRQEIGITWQNEEYALVEQGLQDGDLLVLTPLGQISSGTPVKLNNPAEAGEQASPQEKSKPDRAQRGEGAAP